MKHSGTIKLYNRYDHLLRQLPYYTIEKRKSIMEKWMDLRDSEGTPIDNLDGYFIISVHSAKVGNTVIPDAKKIIERPPCKYDNNKSLYP